MQIIKRVKKSSRPWMIRKYKQYRISILKTWKAKKYKILVLILIILILCSIFQRIPKKLKIYFIDVGQGDSCLIITPRNKSIFIDGGGSENYDIGKNTLLPYLLSRRKTKIDYLIISHFDTDHVRWNFNNYGGIESRKGNS